MYVICFFVVVLLLLFCFVSFFNITRGCFTKKKTNQTNKQKNFLLKVFETLHPEVLPSGVVHPGLGRTAQRRLGTVGVDPEEGCEDDYSAEAFPL